MNRFLVALILAAIPLIGGSQQDPATSTSKAAAANDKFSGTVTELSSDSVTVVRTAPGKSDVTRKFSVDGQTTVEGKLRVRARVTIQYVSADENQFRAVHIIVR